MKLSKIENKWENLTPWEKEKAYEKLSSLMRVRKQKIRVNETPIEDRIEDIKKTFIRGRV